jgi:signal transduction histidine kinase
LTLALALIALAPMALAGWGIRNAVTKRLEEDGARRSSTLINAATAELRIRLLGTRYRLASLTTTLAADNRFRFSGANRAWVLDWAGEAMRANGLTLLLLLDDSDRVISSGHFRNEFDRTIPGLTAMVGQVGDSGVLITTRTADATVRAFATIDSLRVGDRQFYLIGGTRLDSLDVARLAPESEVEVRWAGAGSNQTDPLGSYVLPVIDATGPAPVRGTATLAFSGNPRFARELLRDVDRLFLLAGLVALVAVVAASWWLGRRISDPLGELAAKAEQVDLDRLDQEFDSGRGDEIGVLGRGLDAMAGRLRLSIGRLREAERRAATGDLARQVNHDVKNGLIPIKNVVRHLTATAASEPARLAEIYGERRGTLESSIEYLEGLARNYARLSPTLDRERTDLNRLVGEVARSLGAERPIECRLDPALPGARGDAVAIRRVLENLISNALEAGPGPIVVSTEAAPDGQVRIAVRDAGPGMTEAQLERAFQDFYTTKPDGTGLGLSVVRRLVGDLGGTLRVETAPGRGSTFTVEVPAG